MKNKLVLRVTIGNEDATQHALLAYEMRPAENRYEWWMFLEDDVDAEFIQKLSDDWRNGKPLEFPAAHRNETHELTASGDLLPADCKTDRPDLVTRAKTEWMFSVLSSKLFASYQIEVRSMKERCEQLGAYSKEMWEELRVFWDRVQEQLRLRSLLREQAETIKEDVNQMFDRLKKLRDEEEKRFERDSKAAFDSINTQLTDIEQRIQDGKIDRVRAFRELKALQAEMKDVKLARGARNQLFDRIDAAFKKVKSQGEGGPNIIPQHDPYSGRIAGLADVISKMEGYIERDQKDMENIRKGRHSGSASQLEVQLREAKGSLLEEKIREKLEKLADMRKTHDDLVRKRDRTLAEAEKNRALAETKAKIEAQKKAEAREKEEQAREQMEKAMALIESEKKAAEQAGDGETPKVKGKKGPKAPEAPADETSAIVDTATETAPVADEAVVEPTTEITAESETVEATPMTEEAVVEPTAEAAIESEATEPAFVPETDESSQEDTPTA